ncbi:ABC transporter permease subunit, partial [Mesorhizobium sp.]
GTLLDHTLASLGRIAAALGIGIFVGIPLGLLMGLNRWVKGIFSVPIDLYWGLPPLAYLPLLIIWLGIGETSKIVLLSLSTFAPICFAAQAG